MIGLDRAFGRLLDPVEAVWVAVLEQALEDARSTAKCLEFERASARRWLRRGVDRDRVLILAGLEPGWLDRLLPTLEREWREVDVRIERLRAEGHRSGRWAKPAAHSSNLAT